MPTYEYHCTSCGHQFELVQRMADPPRRRCPRCGRKVERKIGAGAGILFKGSGFYTTDYRSSEYRAREKAEKSGAGSTKGEEKGAGKDAKKDTRKDAKKDSGGKPPGESGTKPAKDSG